MRALLAIGWLVLMGACPAPPGSVAASVASGGEEYPMVQEVCDRVAAWWCHDGCKELGTPLDDCEDIYVRYCCDHAGRCDRPAPMTRNAFEVCMSALEVEPCSQIAAGVKPEACIFDGGT